MPLEAETPAAKTLAAVAAAEVETGTETAVLTKAETFAAMMLMLEAAVPAAEVEIAKLVEPESPADDVEARAETALPLKASTEAGTAIPLKIVAAAPQTLLQLLDLYIFRFHLNRCIPFPTNNELNILSFYTHKYINLN
jgi:PHD/YefM family antitoxin component YafN of YafNO toxin-antitoxin module